jgi:hypothetical protein
MITRFKIFESIGELPKIGDYVIFDSELYKDLNKTFYIFIKSNIGQVVGFREVNRQIGGPELTFDVKFENVPEELTFKKKNFFFKDNVRYCCSAGQFKCWSDNKEDLEIYIDVNKYNI